MTRGQRRGATAPDIITADGPGPAEQQVDRLAATTPAANGKSGEAGAAISDSADNLAAATPREIRARHARHLAELIDRGKDLAIEMFDDAGNREFEETRRIQFVRLADRVTDTTRKLIVSYDRHCQEPR